MFHYLQKLKSPDFDHKEIISLKAYKVLGRWNLLFDEEHYQRKTAAQKIVNLLIMCCPIVHWSSVFLAVLFNLDNFSLPVMGEDIAFSIGGMLVAIRLVQFNRCRAEVSSIVRELNQWNMEMRSEPAGRELSNLAHFWQLVFFGTVTLIGSFIAFPQTVFAVVTAKPYYNLVFPVDPTGRTIGFWVVCAFQLFTLVSSTFSSCLQESILNDMFTEVSMYCYNLNRRIQRLREVNEEGKVDEDVEYARLLKIVRDVQGMEKLLQRSNSYINNFLVLIFTMFYMAIAISAFIIINAAESGAFYIFKSLLYPIFVLQVVFMWCLSGQVLMDQSIHFGSSLMSSNWTDAPLRYRKLMLMFLVQCHRPMEVQAKPFYDINLHAFSDFIKRIYYMLTIMLDMNQRK